jgi:hypothetical protein
MYNNYVELCIITYVYEVSAAVYISIHMYIYIYVIQDTVSLVSLYLSIYPSLSLFIHVYV